jgi:hemolysin D
LGGNITDSVKEAGRSRRSAWACIGEIDIVAVAPGRIVPSGRVKLVQPYTTGLVRQIAVTEGQHVRQGDLLIGLDATSSAADLERASRDFSAMKLEIARLQATIAGDTEFKIQPGTDPGLAASEVVLMLSRQLQLFNKLAGLEQEEDRQRAAAQSARAELDKYSAALPLLSQRSQIYSTLAQEGLVSKVSDLELQQEQVEMANDLAGASARMREAEAEIAAIERQKDEAQSEFRSQRLAELTQAEERAAELSQDLVKAEQRQSYTRLTAPVDGTVQQLALHTLGGVVEPAERLMVIVPDSDTLEIEAQVLNQDIGFVHVGQDAVVKLDAFPFTRYGTIPGKVVTLDRDAATDQKVGLVYTARVTLARRTMLADGRDVELTPGMTGTVEIDTGSRRLIEYVLSPLIRVGSESLRER